jgi:glutamine amidotransferase
MCRFLAYCGDAIFLEELVCAPKHSLLNQSLHAEEAKLPTNGDGFGIGWYGERQEPGIYRELRPAWSDENLLALCRQVRSGLFFAHVRAATGTATTRANCHPFSHGRFLFMHNGQIGGYARIKRKLEAILPDSHYGARMGTTDSELIFLLAIARIEAGESPQNAVLSVLSLIKDLMREAGIAEPLRFAAALADGERFHAFRLSCDPNPPTLYLRQTGGTAIVASEPLDADRGNWALVPAGAVISVGPEQVEIRQVDAIAA